MNARGRMVQLPPLLVCGRVCHSCSVSDTLYIHTQSEREEWEWLTFVSRKASTMFLVGRGAREHAAARLSFNFVHTPNFDDWGMHIEIKWAREKVSNNERQFFFFCSPLFFVVFFFFFFGSSSFELRQFCYVRQFTIELAHRTNTHSHAERLNILLYVALYIAGA